MTSEDSTLLKTLLIRQRVLTLAVLVDGLPYTGLLSFAVSPGFSAAFIHASNLARHTAGLRDGAPFSLLIHAPDTGETDPFQLPRVSLEGKVRLLPKGSADYDEARRVYTARFPTSAQTFALSDFNLYALEVEKGRFVAAFGRIYNLTAETLQRLG